MPDTATQAEPKHVWVELKKAWGGKPVGEQLGMDEEDAQTLIDSGFAEAIDDPTKKTVEKAIEEATNRIHDGLMETVDQAFEKFNNSVKAKIPARAKDPEEDSRGGFDSFGQFAQEVRKSSAGEGVTEKMQGYLSRIEKKAPTGMSESSDTGGGFLVPEQFAAGIYERAFEDAMILGRTDRYTTRSNNMVFRTLDDKSRKTGSRFGGVQGYWLAEADEKPKSRPKFGKKRLELHKLAVLVYATDELLADSDTALAQFLTRVASAEINFLVTDALFSGTGAGQPQGILNANALVTVSRATASQVNAADIIGMWARLHSSARENAVWHVNQDVEPQLHQMTLSGSNTDFLVYMPPNGLAERPFGTLLGRPVITTDHCSALGTEGDVVLVDWSKYISLTKAGTGIESAMSMHLRFDYDETVFRFVFRVDGQPWWDSSLTQFKGSNKLSPYIALTDAS